MAENKVAEQSASIKAMAADIAMTRNLMLGTSAMRIAGEQHMPKWPKERLEDYKTRLAVSTLFPAYSRTVTTLTGKPFSKSITYGDNVPPQIRGWIEDDADLQGRNLDAFASGVFSSALAYGLCGILVDYPVVDLARVRTQADEQAQGLRPYMVQVEPWNILGGRFKRINGVETLTQIRFMEYVMEEDGEFGEKEVAQVRVIEPLKWATYRKNKDDEWVPYRDGITTMQQVPFVPVYGYRTGFLTARPPMLEMAHLNIKHWQSQSDQDNILHVTRVPILYVSGIDDDKFSMTIGSSEAIQLPVGASCGFVEHSGSALGAGRTSLEDLKEEMRQAGAELLVLTPGQITATQVASENAIGMCALQRMVSSTEDAFDQAMQYMADWVKAPEGGNITIFNDFGAATLAEASAQILVGMRQTGDLSKKTLLNEVKRRGILSSEVDVDAEIEAATADAPNIVLPGGAGA